MKVLQINSVCGYGSTGRIAADIYYALLQEQEAGCIAYGRGNAPSDICSYKIGGSWSVLLHGGLSRITDRQGFYSAYETRKLVKWMETYNPDIIHLHNLHGYYLNLKILFQYIKNACKPVVWTLHDCWAFTGHCAHFDYAGCSKWLKGCKRCPQRREYPASLFMDRSEKNYQEKKKLFLGIPVMEIVSPSYWLSALIKQSFLKEYPVTVIHNGIDLNIFKPVSGEFRKKYQLEDKHIILGVANVWTERKGFGTFLKLADMLPEDYRIVLVGLEKEQIKCLKRNMIGIQRTQNREELAELYSMADVFVNPTMEEVFGMVNIEAMACGTPVITYNTGGSPEGIENGFGFVVEKGNIHQLFNKIMEVIQMLRNNDKGLTVVPSNFGGGGKAGNGFIS